MSQQKLLNFKSHRPATTSSIILKLKNTMTSKYDDEFYLKVMIEERIKINETFANAVSWMTKISIYMLVNAGAPRSIWSDTWIFELSSSINPSTFSKGRALPTCQTSGFPSEDCLSCCEHQRNQRKFLFTSSNWVYPSFLFPYHSCFLFKHKVPLNLSSAVDGRTKIMFE